MCESGLNLSSLVQVLVLDSCKQSNEYLESTKCGDLVTSVQMLAPLQGSGAWNYFFLVSGYSIFIVFGSFPECEADALLKLVPAVQSVKPQFLASVKGQNVSSMVSNHDRGSEEDLQHALKLSLGSHESQKEETEPEQAAAISLDTRNSGTKSNESADNQDDLDLQKALRLSLKGHERVPSSSVSLQSTTDDEETELQKALRLSLQGASPVSEQDDLDLEKALKMSLECKSCQLFRNPA